MIKAFAIACIYTVLAEGVVMLFITLRKPSFDSIYVTTWYLIGGIVGVAIHVNYVRKRKFK